MPRRKQGYSKERAPGDYLKNTNPDNALVQNESFKFFPTKNDLLIKFKKNASSNISNTTCNEKTERKNLGLTKSLNDTMVSQQEINNNLVELPPEKVENNNGKSVKKSNLIFKGDKGNNCLDNVSLNSLSSAGLLNLSSSLPSEPNQNKMNKMVLVIQENSNVFRKESSPIKVGYSNIPITVATSHSGQNKETVKRNGEMEKEKLDSEMSGVSPATTNNYGARNKADSEQMNYRISTSIIENNVTQSSKTISTSMEEQSFQLPSSVYGTPASTVEKMLTNHHSPNETNKSGKEGKTSFLQEILEQKLVTSKANSSDFHVDSKSEARLSTQTDSFVSNSLSLPVEKERFHPKLKINVPEGITTDDSNSSVFSNESSKSKFPSPQILEQRINKIISNNIAIVDSSFDAVFTRRYSKQTSSTSINSEIESKKIQSKSEKTSEDTTVSVISSESDLKSKLQSALLGGSEEVYGNSQKNTMITKTCIPQDRIISPFHTAIVPSSATLSKVTGSVTEEELKGSAIKSLLSLRQGQFQKETNAFNFDKDTFSQHPQNPEGSIIKDLLLKSKSQEDLRIHNDDHFYETIYQVKNLTPRLSNTLSKCSRCGAEFPDKNSLEIHISVCFKPVEKNLFKLRDPNESFKLRDINAQSKTSPLDYQNKGKKLVQTEKSKPDYLSENDDGPILKKQLLMPLSKSPPVKRRKVSDSVISSFFANQNSNYDSKSNSTKIANNPELPPYRNRSQSVHMFGGEVHVLDGYRTKKIKIQNLPGAFSSVTSKFVDYSFNKLDLSKELEKDTSNLSAAVVTIAQPVHNSGGTLHLPTRQSTSTVSSPVVSLPNILTDVLRYTKFEPTSNSNLSNSGNMTVSKDAYLPSQNKSVFMPSQTSDIFYSSSKASCVLPGPMLEELSPLSKATISPTNKPFYSPIFSNTEVKFEQPVSVKERDSECINNRSLPTVLFTPSSPTFPSVEEETSSANSISEPNKKFLAPTRPTSLPLKKKHITMVSFGTGTTLVSPETPRPKKSCVQLYLNGHAYTYLGLKCSTRSTYCCIYRPQPMFILQETNPKLSMYSNWQVVPAKEELGGLTPGQMISFYNSKQRKDAKSVTAMSKLGEPLIFTHSSYWTYRSQDKIEQNEGKVISSNVDELKTPEITQDSNPTENIRSESVITSVVSKPQPAQLLSGDESSIPLDTENTLSDGDANNSNDDEDDDCQDDGTESLTDSSQPQPPKRVKIFEGGFKSNEDYTYVRGRGRGKYVCEECGIRCKKPSMLKKHIRTHTDLRPYKCKHCSFAFKTKGNLTKHMKSKAHHKKCTELGIIPVPTSTDDYQIDAEILAKQEQIEKKKRQFSDGEEADDDDDEDTEDSDEECESDASSLIVTSQKSRMLTNGHSKKSDSQEKSTDSFDESTRGHESISQQAEEHEVARSLLNLSAFGEPSQWSTSTGDLTDVTSPGGSEVGSLTLSHDQSLLSPSLSSTQSISSTVISTKSKNVSDQWLSTETLGHRPRSYSADIPLSGGKQMKYKLVKDIIAETGSKLHSEDTSEFGGREQFGRRYSISVAREARKPRALNPQEYSTIDLSTLNSHRWRDAESADQPMDLSVTRDFNKCKPVYPAEMTSSLINVVTQEESLPDINITTSIDSCLSESYQLKSLPVLSPQVLVDYETNENSASESTLLPLVDDQSSLGASTSRQLFYMQDIPLIENITKRRDAENSEDPSSPDMVDYAAVCSPVSPPTLDDNSYYYSQESNVQINNPEEMPTSSRHQAEFIVPSTSSSGTVEEGKCVCRICNKMFAKSSHLRLHVNIHYFERPFRCDNCAVSFRTKGHLQKHKRSVSHYNKVNMNLTFGTPTVDNPRPFKCADCKIAFRIHGHLAKHLRSKMHIMKLECLGKLPFGMYAEMERSGVSLNEIDTTDCNNSLESLQVMAQKLYQRDPRRMRWQGTEQTADSTCAIPSLSSNAQTLIDSILPIETLTTSFDPIGRNVGMPSATLANSKPSSSKDEAKLETSQANILQIVSTQVDTNSAISSLPRYIASHPATSGPDSAPQTEAPEVESAMSLNRSGTCHICGRHFKSAKFLQVHLYCDHPALTSSSTETPSVNPSSIVVQSGNLACDLCGKVFPNQKVLQMHLLSHAQPRPFVCDVCDAGFTSSSSLVAHQATHQDNSSTSDSRLVQLK